MESELTVCLTNWARPEQLSSIIDQLLTQSCRPKIFVWNNNPDTPWKDDRVDLVINSGKNIKMLHLPMFWQLADTPFVGKMDDDLFFADDKVLEDAVARLKKLRGPTQLLGAFGVKIRDKETYETGQHISTPKGQGQHVKGTRLDNKTPLRRPHDMPVDFIKGRFILANSAAAPLLNSICPHHHMDLHISMTLAGRRRLHHVVAGCFFNRQKEIGRLIDFPEDSHGYCAQDSHLVDRNQICDNWLRAAK